MFTAWGRLLATRARLVVTLAVATILLAVVGLVTVAPSLSSEGFVSGDAESTRVDQALVADFGQSDESLVFLFDAAGPVSDPAVQAAVEAALAPVAADPHVRTVLTTWSTGNPRMVSDDGTATYAVAVVAAGDDLADADAESLAAAVHTAVTAGGLAVQAGGGPMVGVEIGTGVEEGLVRAETFSVPASLLIQVLVFGSLVAAGIPLLIAALAILASVSLILVLSTDVFQSIFAINIITMLGLGLGIDYSLFMITRFREELGRRPVAEAVTVTMATVGKAILISGVTVIVGLAATQFFPLPALQSMGQAGMAVTALALLYGLTLLPAVLALLGHRVNRLRIGRGRVAPATQQSAFWFRVASMVMRRPVAVAGTVLAVLLLLTLPLLRLDITPGGPEVLPTGSEARTVSERLATDFAAADAETIPVLVRFADGDAVTPASVAELRALTDRFSTITGVSGTESFVGADLATANGFDWAAWDGDVASLPAAIADDVSRTVRGDRATVQVLSTVQGAALEQVVRDIRAVQPEGFDVTVGGFAASSVDTVDGIDAGLLPAALFVLIASYLILLLTFGSVLLPLKAIATTLLSIGAALGAVVLVFQDGRFESLLGFTASGEIISTTPILIFCILFGLSMDYEVLMLSRIQEEYRRTGDARGAVATGLARSGRTITGAAAIMVVVFGGFMLADISILKSMGFGLALAVLIDATVVRGLLVPATMRLLGDRAWWAPAPVGRLVERLGLGHESALPHADSPVPSAGAAD